MVSPTLIVEAQRLPFRRTSFDNFSRVDLILDWVWFIVQGLRVSSSRALFRFSGFGIRCWSLRVEDLKVEGVSRAL